MRLTAWWVLFTLLRTYPQPFIFFIIPFLLISIEQVHIMDVRRIVLMAGIAILTYYLILQWNNDYGQRKPPLASNHQSTQSISQNDSIDIPDGVSTTDDTLPQTSLNHSSVSDIPEDIEQEPVVVASSNNTDFISVKTDTFDLKIDPKGGDIVFLSLPQYPLYQDQPEIPFTLLDQSRNLTYTSQSGVAGSQGFDTKKLGRADFSSSQKNYQLNEGAGSIDVDLYLERDGLKVTKRFHFQRDSYVIGVSYIVENQSSQAWQGRFFSQIKRDGSADPTQSGGMGMSTYLGAAYRSPDNIFEKAHFDDISESTIKTEVKDGWLAMSQLYFISAWIPPKDETFNYTFLRNRQDGNYIMRLTSGYYTAQPGETTQFGAQFYAGPKIQQDLGELAEGLDLTVDYGWLWFIAQPLFWLLTYIHSLIGNWGWSIILLTALIKICFFHLSAKSYASMAKMRKAAPKMQAIKERYGDDRQKMSSEMMNFYKKEKINPLGGCLPHLVQLPVFLALYWVLLESVELRHAPFMLWIKDLSVQDPYFVLPLLMGVSMFIQMQLNPAPQDPVQAKVMKFMPIMFTFFFLFFPSGLVLYWVVNNILSILQQWVITRNIEKSDETAKAAT